MRLLLWCIVLNLSLLLLLLALIFKAPDLERVCPVPETQGGVTERAHKEACAGLQQLVDKAAAAVVRHVAGCVLVAFHQKSLQRAIFA